ncbi:MAG: helix-turn-helix transcriptional regulator [Burkholderiaceae bacterium]|jgi:transcriptional regulator with XRE-family HTH domain|nr:helix-turn-helix transcriptional regulator [Burkholderiaceae bacterium]
MGTDQLIDALKRILRSRRVTYADLARRIGLSEASVKRLFSQGTFTLSRLQQVLQALEMDFFELARLARGAGDAPQEMTEAQEHALASEPHLMGVFYLLFNDWQPAQILARYELAPVELTRLLAKLDRLQLIDLLPGDRVKLRVSRHLRLKPGGAIRARHGQRAMTEFLAVEFDRHGGHFLFEFRDISPASLAVMQRKIDRLAAEFNELAELDSTLPPEQRHSIGLALGMRPWRIGQVTGLKERPRRR